MIRPISSSRCMGVARLGLVAVLVFVSSYCTQNGRETENVELTPDEAYVAQTVARLAAARDLHAASYEESESLFTVLDSTIDTARVHNVIRDLRANPGRWVLVFRRVNQLLESDIPADAPSEEGR